MQLQEQAETIASDAKEALLGSFHVELDVTLVETGLLGSRVRDRDRVRARGD